MKKILMGILFVLIIVGNLFAQDAPTGIGGLTWGDPIEKFQELKDPTGFGLKDMGNGIHVGGRWISLGDVACGITPSIYNFYMNRFYFFMFPIREKEKSLAIKKFGTLKEALISKYGAPSKQTPLPSDSTYSDQSTTEYQWNLRDVWIKLKWDTLTSKGSLSYCYVPILIEKVKNDRGREKESLEKTKDSL